MMGCGFPGATPGGYGGGFPREEKAMGRPAFEECSSKKQLVAVADLLADTLQLLMARAGVEAPSQLDPEQFAEELVAGILRGGAARKELIARVAHEVNRAYCEALGDHSQVSWEAAPEWQRESCRAGVDLHLMGDFGPEASHEAWFRHKAAQGWAWGSEKNEDRKLHPCMVPFRLLPKEQQAKDFIFRAVVHALK